MPRSFFVSFTVVDLSQSRAFREARGFFFNPDISGNGIAGTAKVNEVPRGFTSASWQNVVPAFRQAD